jgi:hypothetical protein
MTQTTDKPAQFSTHTTARTTQNVKGRASYYCCTRGYSSGQLVAAAGPALRRGDWRGRKVQVCRSGKCISVRLVDWCQCYKGERRERIIDLHPGAFRALGPLSAGILTVRVGW